MNLMKVTKFWLGKQCLERRDHGSLAIAPFVKQLFSEGVALNTTGSVFRASSGSEVEFSGSPTEKAILSWAVNELHMDVDKVKRACAIVNVETFDSKKRSGVWRR